MKRYEVWLVNLDPVIGHEIKKTRPCIIVSPEIINKKLNTLTIVPLTSTIKNFPHRVPCTFLGKSGEAVIEQVRIVDKKRLLNRMGAINNLTAKSIALTLIEYFKF